MWMSQMTVLPLFICLSLSILLAYSLFHRGNVAAHKDLLVWAIAATLLYSGHCAFFNLEVDQMPFYDSVYVMCNLAVFPLYFVYLSRLTEGRVTLWAKFWAYVLPFAVGLPVAFLYLAMSPRELHEFTWSYLYHGHFQGMEGVCLAQAIVHHVSRAIFAVGVVLTMVLGIRKIRNYNNLIDSIYSDTEDKRLHSFEPILKWLLLMCVLSVVANALGRYTFSNSVGMLALAFLPFSALLLALGIVGYRQRFSYRDIVLPQDTTPEVAEERDDAGEEASRVNQELVDKIKELMKENVFLTPNLKVSDLAKRLGTNDRYVQQALNEGMGMSFAELINRCRVDYAEKLMKSNSGICISDVYIQSGFSSQSAFYRNFKRYKNYSPKSFMQQQ